MRIHEKEYYVITQYEKWEGHSEPLYIYDDRQAALAKLYELSKEYPSTDFRITGLALGKGNTMSIYVD